MKLKRAIGATLRSKRFWVWQLGGIIIYGIPVAIRFATRSVQLPILSLLETPAIDHYIPNNLVEKILVNAFFPGGAGAVAGEVFVDNCTSDTIKRKTAYLSRLGGALLQTAVWSAFQYWGFSLRILGPWSIGGDWGNIFEHWSVFPLNFVLAAFSIFTPDIVSFLKSTVSSTRRKLSRKTYSNAMSLSEANF
jgi:hypothetical protein